jgi:carotenoid cleavage dioxygenase
MSTDTMPSDATPPRDYVTGALAPVTEEVTITDLAITGTLPPELDGRYVRNGPNPIDPDPTTQHWFTGAGMVHGVRLRDGRAEWYRNRWVRTDGVTDALGEAPCPGERRDGAPSTAVNTNVVCLDGRTFALVEAGQWPVELTNELDTVAINNFDGTLQGSYSAHPHTDPRTGLTHAVTYHWTEECIRHVVLDTNARVIREEPVAVTGGPMVHDTAITESRVLLFDLPVVFDLDAALGGSPFPYHWVDDRSGRVGLLGLDAPGDSVTWVEVDPCYVFHPMNAHDRPDGGVVVDVCRWDRMFEHDRLGPNEGTPRLERWEIDPARGRVDVTVIDDRAQEFPRINERLTGTPHRFGVTAGLASAGAAHAPLFHHDLTAGTTSTIDFGPTSAAQEFVVVPRGASTAEDDAWLIGLVTDRAEATTDLVVLAADDPTGGPVARVHLGRRIPDGFHGNWMPTA